MPRFHPLPFGRGFPARLLVSVNGQIQLQWEGPPNGNMTVLLHNGTEYVYDHSTVLLQNGTRYVLNGTNSEVTISFHFPGKHFVGQMTSEGGIINESLSPGHPIDSGAIRNVSVGFYRNLFPGYMAGEGQGTNYFSVYIENSVLATITVDGAPL